MASLDVDSLFTNIPLKETINICVENLFKKQTHIGNLSKESFKELLTLATFESFFVFDGKYHKECDGVAMGSPLGPTLANAFLCHYEKLWLQNCPVDFKPIIYKKYVDDIFVLFLSKDHLLQFKNYMNSKHINISFTTEVECNDSISFLDVKITRISDKFTTLVYSKPTFSGVFTNFGSFLPINYKYSLVFTLLYRAFSICSSFTKFHEEIIKLKEIFKNNGYPNGFINLCVKKSLDEIFIKNRKFNYSFQKRNNFHPAIFR